MATEAIEQVNGQLVPLDSDGMLVPNAAVQDVVALDQLQVRVSPPSWLLGTINWRGNDIPVISVEGLLGSEVPARMRRNRVVIMSGFGRHLPPGLFGVISQGHSHLMTLNRVALHAAPLESTDPEEFVISRVRIANARAFIPDLDAIEQRLADAVAQNAASEPVADWVPDSAERSAGVTDDDEIVDIDF